VLAPVTSGTCVRVGTSTRSRVEDSWRQRPATDGCPDRAGALVFAEEA
jgi:hypothetical protein